MDNSKISNVHSTFPLSRKAADALGDQAEYDYSFLHTARRLTNWLREHYPRKSSPVSPGELTAAGLMGKIIYSVIDYYLVEQNPQLFRKYSSYLSEKLDPPLPYAALVDFVKLFPPAALLTSRQSPEEYLSSLQKTPSRFRLETFGLLLYILADKNPAFKPYSLLFSDQTFSSSASYHQTSQAALSFFDKQPGFHRNQSLLAFLKKPFLENPYSISGQLSYMLNHWSEFITPGMLLGAHRSLDYIREDHKTGGGKAAPIEAPDYSSLSEDALPEKSDFSPDQDWMPEVVLLAKNIYVWLEQLSRFYRQEISRLDQIPDEELQKLSSWGISSLWLIGIWKRSPASKKIKQLCGNPDAEASAYALFDYEIADSLGGKSAFRELERRSNNFGIRLAADMVPNHVGIDSRWVRDHPDWFLSLAEKPFPSYSYQGPDLVSSPDLGIYLEDHYYDKSDAAVVFQRVDRKTGNTRYIYHGNDGTAMPWNDTAQLNFLQQEVRSAVIDNILKVARKFSVIRFDAAMTLTKKHYQRLWFPEPGDGGAIPSRAEHGLSKKEFDRLFPCEFWREVVDRIAAEAPNTLLLAEAFWMMEGYFVRTLGMHRVYNSAFMNMLKDELNAEYRELIIETLAFDPQILKRYVNFMNNPDEETAVAQFGKGGKYFGVCLLMTTMPGLPMFGHGQVEGLTEKYGMEYRKPYYDEETDKDLVRRHEREIFPLLKKRYLFAGVDSFVLYDFTQTDGKTNEDVFAYSNYAGGECALIIFHNQWGDTQGAVQYSASPHNPDLDLNQALNLGLSPGNFLTYRDQITGLEYIRPADQILSSGLSMHLGAYQYHAFVDFKQLSAEDETLDMVAKNLSGRGVLDLKAEIEIAYFEAILEFMENLITPQLLNAVFSSSLLTSSEESDKQNKFGNLQDKITEELQARVQKLPTHYLEIKAEQLSPPTVSPLEIIHDLWLLKQPPVTSTSAFEELVLLLFSITLPLIPRLNSEGLDKLIDLTSRRLANFLNHTSHGRISLALKSICAPADPELTAPPSSELDLSRWFTSGPEREYLNVHEYQGVLWFQKEAFQSLAALKLIKNAVQKYLTLSCLPAADPVPTTTLTESYQLLIEQAEKSNYQVNQLLTSLSRH
ncbi:MAG: alpha-amylase family glycosyl hydrolase [Anaerolineales bacterium]|nr:alpha-amylase family glycosyl hydrolase [Anaerolineales bacterium]